MAQREEKNDELEASRLGPLTNGGAFQRKTAEGRVDLTC